MNITKYRANLKKFGDVNFALGKETCYIIYKGAVLMTCDRVKGDSYSFDLLDEEMLLKEMRYRDELWSFWKIISIIRFPIRSYKRYLKGYDLI